MSGVRYTGDFGVVGPEIRVNCSVLLLRPVTRLNVVYQTSIQIVHGFAVAPIAFRPLLWRLRRDSLLATLYRYPSVGLGLDDIVYRLSSNLREQRPDAIVAHSLGCIVTWLAAHETNWHGPLVLLAPPFTTIPSTRLIPRFLRWPFAPLLDHRSLTTTPGFQLPTLVGCDIKTVAGRFDTSVPLSCTHNNDVDEASVTLHTHNSMLFSSAVAKTCSDWVVRYRGTGNNDVHSRIRTERFGDGTSLARPR